MAAQISQQMFLSRAVPNLPQLWIDCILFFLRQVISSKCTNNNFSTHNSLFLTNSFCTMLTHNVGLLFVASLCSTLLPWLEHTNEWSSS